MITNDVSYYINLLIRK